MRKIVNPKQKMLFDPFNAVLTEKTLTRLLEGWEGVFHNVKLSRLR